MNTYSPSYQWAEQDRMSSVGWKPVKEKDNSIKSYVDGNEKQLHYSPLQYAIKNNHDNTKSVDMKIKGCYGDP